MAFLHSLLVTKGIAADRKMASGGQERRDACQMRLKEAVVSQLECIAVKAKKIY